MKTLPLRRFLTRLIWLCIFPLILLAAYLAFDRVRDAQADGDLAAANLAANFATAVDSELSARIKGLQVLAASPLADEVSRHHDLYRQAQGFVTSFGSHVIIADPQGQMLLNTRVPFGAALPKLPRPSGRAAAPMALETGVPAVGDIFFGPVAKEPLVAIVVPAKRQGQIAFLALTTLETQQMQKRLEQVALPADWSLALLDGTGAAIARRGPAAFSSGSAINAGHRFVVKSKLSAWSVQLEISRAAYRTPLLEVALMLALFILATTLVGLLGGTLAGRRLSRSLAALAQPTEPGAPLPAIEEVAAVRHRLDAAANDRAAAGLALRASEQRLRDAMDNVHMLAVMLDAHGNVTYCNDFMLRLCGWQRDELLGRNWFEAILPDPAPVQMTFEQAMRDGNLPSHYENEIVTRSGVRLLVHWNNTLLRDENQRLAGSFSLGEDITERKLAQEKIHEQVDELMRWQAVMLGREERMLQLKAEVNEQLARQGELARYASEAKS